MYVTIDEVGFADSERTNFFSPASRCSSFIVARSFLSDASCFSIAFVLSIHAINHLVRLVYVCNASAAEMFDGLGESDPPWRSYVGSSSLGYIPDRRCFP